MPWTMWLSGHKVDNQGVIVKSVPCGGDFLFPKCELQPWAPTSILFNGYCELFLPGVKWLADKTDHTHLSFGEYSIWRHGTNRDIFYLYP
jgi:hypothetical protein